MTAPKERARSAIDALLAAADWAGQEFKIVPPASDKEKADAAGARLRGSALMYDRPLEPAFDADAWEMNR